MINLVLFRQSSYVSINNALHAGHVIVSTPASSCTHSFTPGWSETKMNVDKLPCPRVFKAEIEPGTSRIRSFTNIPQCS